MPLDAEGDHHPTAGRVGRVYRHLGHGATWPADLATVLPTILPAHLPAVDDIAARVATWPGRKGIIPAAVAPGWGTRSVAKEPSSVRGSAGAQSERSTSRHRARQLPARGIGSVVEGGCREASETAAPAPVEFVAEADVKRALERGDRIRIGPQTIITPLARDLGEQHDILTRR